MNALASVNQHEDRPRPRLLIPFRDAAFLAGVGLDSICKNSAPVRMAGK